MPAPSQLELNNVVWTISLVLQVLLVGALVARKIHRRLPAFTVLVTFYPIRATLLFALYGHIAPHHYATLYSSLSLLDLLLQTAVAVEVLHHLMREWGGWTVPRAGLLLLLLLVASACTLGLVQLLPARSPVPVDRAQTFLSCFMILLFVWTIVVSRSALLRPVMLGLALYGSISLASQTGRTVAAAHRDVAAYARWSYASATGYLLVVALWLLTLKLQSTPEALPAEA